MEINNELPKEDSSNLVNSFHLSYAGTAKVDNSVSLATDKKTASNSQCVENEVPALKRVPKLCGKSKSKQIKGSDLTFLEYMSNNMYNVQIPYNMN